MSHTINTRSNMSSWRQREQMKAEQERAAALRKQTEKTEQNFPTLVTTARRIRSAPQGFAAKAEMWRVQEELQKQLEAYRNARTARQRRMIMNTVFVFQRRAATNNYEEDDYEEEEWRDLTLDEIYPPHGRRGTYGPVHCDPEFGKLAAEHAAPNPDGTKPTAEEFSDGWRLVTRLPFRPPRGELTEEQLHEMYLERGNEEDEEDEDVNADLTERNQRRNFY